MNFKKSYLTGLALLLILTAGAGVQGQSIYLDPDVQYVTTGVGTEFDLELRVDDGFPSLKSFVYHLDFDPSKLDIISVTQGPLLPSSPLGVNATAFAHYIVDDRLEVQDLILGAGVDVAGPGLLATIRFQVLALGSVDLAVSHHRLRNVAGTLLTTEAYGAMVYINVPPEPFDLLAPIQGDAVNGLPGDFIELSWEAALSPYPGEDATYTLEYSTSAGFEPSEMWTVSGLTGTSHQLAVDDLVWDWEGTYYWRLTATGNLYGFERQSTPEYETFEFGYTPTSPDPFDLTAPLDLAEISSASNINFDWEDAVSPIPGDQVSYTFYLATQPAVQSGPLVTAPVAASGLLVSAATLPRNQALYWGVAAEGNYGMDRFSTSIFSVTLLGCCVGRPGDANGEGGDEPTIGDVSVIIDAKFITGTCDGILECLSEADVNQSGGFEPTCSDISISDISILIDYLFITGQILGLPDCL